jgi:uncharacterized LabA/DUF88 family protein
MFYSAKNQYNAKLNFARLLEVAVGDRQLIRALAYVVESPDIDQSNFITMLRENGYEIKSKELRVRPDGSAKGDWDMGIAIDTISMADRLDTIVLVSGDGDFVDLVECLKARGVRVEVYAFPYSTADELRVAANEFFEIGPDLLISNTLRRNGRFRATPERERPTAERGYAERTYADRSSLLRERE